MFLIVDEIVEQLLCSVCKKYLFVKPIKVYLNGIVKCGRCSEDSDDGTVSLYNNLLDSCIFRCINRFEGCKSYLTPSDITSHEEGCTSGAYFCPLCPPDSLQENSSYLFVWHFKTCHKDSILDKPEVNFQVKIESKNYFLYQQEDLVYLLYIRFDNSNDRLILNASTLGTLERTNSIKQKIQVLNLKEQCLHTTAWQSCSLFADNSKSFVIPMLELEESTEYILRFHFNTGNLYKLLTVPSLKAIPSKRVNNDKVGIHNRYPKMYLSEEFKQKYPDYYLSPCRTKLLRTVDNVEEVFPRICCFCENTFIHSNEPNIFKCGRDHYYCSICYNYEAFCRKSHIDKLSCTATETMIYTLLYFYCKWHCHRFYCGSDLAFHEKNCRNIVHPKFSQNVIMKMTNVFSSEKINFKDSPCVHVITRDNFEFNLYSKCDGDKISIWIRHKYDLDKYYILFRIKDKFSTMEMHKVNAFQLHSKNEPFYFAVLLRKCDHPDND